MLKNRHQQEKNYSSCLFDALVETVNLKEI